MILKGSMKWSASLASLETQFGLSRQSGKVFSDPENASFELLKTIKIIYKKIFESHTYTHLN
jgi:hypothetical protein